MSSGSSNHENFREEKGQSENRPSSSDRDKSPEPKKPGDSPREFDKPPRPSREHRNGDDGHAKREERKRSASVSDDAANDGKTVYVSNLNQITEERDLQDFFRSYGEITNLNLIRNHVTHQSKRFCFITYASQDQAQLAIREVNNQELQGAKLRVEIAHRQKPRRKTPGKYYGRNERGGEEHRYSRPRHPRRSRTPSPDEREYFGDKNRSGEHKRPRYYDKAFDREQNYDPERIRNRDSFGGHSRHKYHNDERETRRESHRDRHEYSHRDKPSFRDDNYDRGGKFRPPGEYSKHRPAHRQYPKEDSRPHFDPGEYKEKSGHDRRKYSKNKSKSPHSSHSPR